MRLRGLLFGQLPQVPITSMQGKIYGGSGEPQPIPAVLYSRFDSFVLLRRFGAERCGVAPTFLSLGIAYGITGASSGTECNVLFLSDDSGRQTRRRESGSHKALCIAQRTFQYLVDPRR